VVSTLKGLALRSQRPILSALARQERGQVRDVRVLWGVNGLALEATRDAIERLAARPEVRWVLYDRATAHPDTGRPAGIDGAGPNPNATVAWEVIAHGAATLYRIRRAIAPQGPWIEVGSATSTQWANVDALGALDSYFDQVTAENSGGSE
jgi:hypothetical protein